MDNEQGYELIIKEKFGEVIKKLEARYRESVLLGLRNVVEESELYTDYLKVALKFEKLAMRIAGGSSLSTENMSKAEIIDMFEHLALDDMKLENIQHVTDEADCRACKSQTFEQEGDKFRFNKCGFLRSVRQPLLIEGGIMRNYQLDGMGWLKLLYGSAVTGVLADDTGLGKRIQCIAAICHIIETGVRGPFLVCAPASVLCKWDSQFKTFAPMVPTHLYTGDSRDFLTKKEKPILARLFVTYPIQLISLELLMTEIKHFQSQDWKYAILDWENDSGDLDYKFLKDFRKLNSENFLLVARTPSQNNLPDLWFLLNFLMPEMFDELVTYETWFDEHFQNAQGSETLLQLEEEQCVISLMERVISPFMLRRLKDDVKINVPHKKDVIIYSPLTPVQEKLCSYSVDTGMKDVVFPKKRNLVLDVKDNGENEPKSTNDETSETETAKETDRFNNSVKFTCIQLRKIINHPYLFEYPLYSATKDRKIDDSLIRYSGKFRILDSMLHSLKDIGHKVIVFTSLLSLIFVLEDYLIYRGYKYTRLHEAQNNDQREDEEVFIYIATSQPGGPGINVAAVANSIIIFDSDWELKHHVMSKDNYQGIDNSYPVVIYRIVSSTTIEKLLCYRTSSKKKLELRDLDVDDEEAKKI